MMNKNENAKLTEKEAEELNEEQLGQVSGGVVERPDIHEPNGDRDGGHNPPTRPGTRK